MLKQLKSVSMLLFLLTMSVEAAYPETGESTLKVSVVQQGTTCKGVVKDAAGETIIGASFTTPLQILLCCTTETFKVLTVSG